MECLPQIFSKSQINNLNFTVITCNNLAPQARAHLLCLPFIFPIHQSMPHPPACPHALVHYRRPHLRPPTSVFITLHRLLSLWSALLAAILSNNVCRPYKSFISRYKTRVAEGLRGGVDETNGWTQGPHRDPGGPRKGLQKPALTRGRVQ